jgi:hypothetical protein
MKKVNSKETQGHNKMVRLLQDLIEEDATFMQRVEKIRQLPSHEKDLAVFELAANYGLKTGQLSPLVRLIQDGGIDFSQPHELDMCLITDDYDEFFGSSELDIPIKENRTLENKYLSFPISLGISPNASQRDVIDFIKKNWNFIEDRLNLYREKRLLLRSRPKRERNIFIMKNKDLPREELSNLIEKQFGELLGTEDIAAIISGEMKRKTKK